MVMTIVMWIRVHPYKATHFENRKSILYFIAFMVLHTGITSVITSLFMHWRKRNQEGNRFGIYKYLGTAIWIHDIMLGTKHNAWNKERIGKRCKKWRNLCWFAAGGNALLFHFARCPALPKITLGQATQCHVYVIGLFHLHTCKLIKSVGQYLLLLSSSFHTSEFFTYQSRSIYSHLWSLDEFS